jgi:hypothetical protein
MRCFCKKKKMYSKKKIRKGSAISKNLISGVHDLRMLRIAALEYSNWFRVY